MLFGTTPKINETVNLYSQTDKHLLNNIEYGSNTSRPRTSIGCDIDSFFETLPCRNTKEILTPNNSQKDNKETGHDSIPIEIIKRNKPSVLN